MSLLDRSIKIRDRPQPPVNSDDLPDIKPQIFNLLGEQDRMILGGGDVFAETAAYCKN